MRYTLKLIAQITTVDNTWSMATTLLSKDKYVFAEEEQDDEPAPTTLEHRNKVSMVIDDD